MRVQAKLHACKMCKLVKPASDFHRYKNGTRASSCNACRRERPNGPKEGVLAPNPCIHCGQRFVLKAPPSRVKARKTCSIACRLAAMRSGKHTCVRCKRELPFEAFPRDRVRRGVKRSCKECAADARRDMRSDLVLRPSVYALAVKLRRHAQVRGVPYELTKTQVKKIHRAPCSLCGKAVSAAVPKAFELPYNMDNLRPLCMVCARYVRITSWEELLLTANEIAAFASLSAQAQEQNREV